MNEKMNEQMNIEYESGRARQTHIRKMKVSNELRFEKKLKYQSNLWFYLEQEKAISLS